MSLLFLNEDELRQTINLSETRAALKAALQAADDRRIEGLDGFTLSLSEVNGLVGVAGTYSQEAPYYVIKIDNSFKNNPDINLPVTSGMIAIFDAATGFPAAILLDGGYVSRVRAGVVGTLAVEYLANEDAKTVAIIGTGQQAYIQLKSLLASRHFELIKIWGHTLLKADAFVHRILEDHDANLVIAPSREIAVRDADIVITTVSGEQPLIEADWLKPGVHITAVGSPTSTKQGLALDVLQQANVIVVDNLEQCLYRGELHHGLSSGVLHQEDIQGELGDLVCGKIPGRTDHKQVTLADVTGLNWQDAVIAIIAMEKAKFLGLGQRLDQNIMQRRKKLGIEYLS